MPFAAVYSGGQIRLSRLNLKTLQFEIVEGFSAEALSGLERFVAFPLPNHRLAILNTKSVANTTFLGVEPVMMFGTLN